MVYAEPGEGGGAGFFYVGGVAADGGFSFGIAQVAEFGAEENF